MAARRTSRSSSTTKSSATKRKAGGQKDAKRGQAKPMAKLESPESDKTEPATSRGGADKTGGANKTSAKPAKKSKARSTSSPTRSDETAPKKASSKQTASKRSSSRSTTKQVNKSSEKQAAAPSSKTTKSTQSTTTQAQPARQARAAAGKTATPTPTLTTQESTRMATDSMFELPAPKGTTKDGITYTKDFTAKFLASQRAALTAERDRLVGQADRLEGEAQALIEEGEMGDVQFDDESGEGDTMVVEREHDLAMSAEARQTVIEIDAALERIADGTYGYSIVSGMPIPVARLEAIPWATVLVEEKVGSIGRR